MCPYADLLIEGIPNADATTVIEAIEYAHAHSHNLIPYFLLTPPRGRIHLQEGHKDQQL